MMRVKVASLMSDSNTDPNSSSALTRSSSAWSASTRPCGSAPSAEGGSPGGKMQRGELLRRRIRHGYSARTNLRVKVLDFIQLGGPCGDRTHDTRIKSPVLCLAELTARDNRGLPKPRNNCSTAFLRAPHLRSRRAGDQYVPIALGWHGSVWCQPYPGARPHCDLV